jgi:transposase
MTKMGRPRLELEVQHEVGELKAAYRACKDAVERRRIQAVWLLASGKSREDVKAVTAYSHGSLVKVIKRYNEGGLAGLQDQRHHNSGQRTLLSEEEQQALYTALCHPPEEGAGAWSGKQVMIWVKQHLGKDIGRSGSYVYLERLGFSLQRPRPRHAKADEEAQAHFKKTP